MILALVPLLLFAAPASFDELLRAGLIALNQNDLARAQKQLEAASKIQPGRAEVWLGLAQTYWKQHQPKLADAAAAKAEPLAAGNAAILRALALYYSEAGQYAKAATRLQAAIRLRPYEEAYYFELSQLYLREQKFEPALDTLNSGSKLFDKSAQLELARGVALYGLRRFPEAIDSFLRTIQLAPEVPQPYLFLGRMLDQAESKLPEIARAFAGYQNANPRSYLGSFLSAKALVLENGDPARIESLLRESVGKNDGFWESHFELGLLLEKRRDFAGAAGEIEKAVALNPNDATPHYRLARIYDRLGRKVEADAQREIHAKLSATERSGMQNPALVLK
jgi:tetratricopeptide (TPR) repeat protein